MKRKLWWLTVVALLPLPAIAQAPYPPPPAAPGKIIRLEYFFDNDPGPGKGFSITPAVAQDIQAFTTTIPLNGLPAGLHKLYLRALDDQGKWSLASHAFFSSFYAPSYPEAPAMSNLQEMEYYVDTDPGQGKGKKVPVTAATDLNKTFIADITGASKGVHRIFIRTKNAAGHWSLTSFGIFDTNAADPYPDAPPPSPALTDLEFFIDTDPGFGQGTKIAINDKDVQRTVLVNVAGLAPGVHRLLIRSRDATGTWSLTSYSIFDNSALTPYPSAPPPAPPVQIMEFFIDTDPGFGNGQPVAFSPGNDISGLSFSLPLTGLMQGKHTLYIRSKQNPWSLTTVSEFVFGTALPVTWIYVKGELVNRDALITWATAQESNTDKFVIEHSRDGMKYHAVGEVTAAGNSSATRKYNFRHTNPAAGFNYYRIGQLDKDGRSTYSKVISLLLRDGLKQAILSPNPAADMVHIVLPQAVAVQEVRVYDAQGRPVLKTILNSTNTQVVSVPVAQLPGGSYILKLETRNGTKTFRFLKQ